MTYRRDVESAASRGKAVSELIELYSGRGKLSKGNTRKDATFWKYVPRAGAVCVEAGYFNETYIADAAGRVLWRVPPEVECYALAEVALSDSPPQPRGEQPPFGVSAFAYLLDAFANGVLPKAYRRGMRHADGQQTLLANSSTKM